MFGFIVTLLTPKIQTFRDTIREISPKWLKHGTAEKLLYAIVIHLDLLGDAAAAGVKKRFPLVLDSVDALGSTGRDRKIARGPAEGEQAYANRLLTWLDDHRTRGGPYALLQQLRAFWLEAFDIDLVYESGKRFHAPAGSGAIVESIGSPWDADTAHWARWWLVFDWPGAFGPDGTWGSGGTWDDGGVWDSDLSASAVANIRLVPHEWNAAHTKGHVTLKAAGSELWDFPAGLWSDPGTWGGSAVTVTLATE